MLFFLTKKIYKECDSKFVLGAWLLCSAFSLCMAILLTFSSFSSNIEIFNGAYIKRNNSNFFPFTYTFYFESDEIIDEFFLDSFSIKNHYANSLEEEKTYNIYYKKCFLNGKIIVGIEETN